MRPTCPHCPKTSVSHEQEQHSVRIGYFYRKSDSRRIQRFRCLKCKRTYSRATSHPCYHQNKRHKNEPLRKLLCSGVSLRRSARLLHLSRTTVARKLIFLGREAQRIFTARNQAHSLSQIIEFDDLETFEHSKCKPISVTMAVEHRSRRILGFTVASMPAKGLLTAKALKKYGRRPDHRRAQRKALFAKLQQQVLPFAEIKSDQNPHYPALLKEYFPKALHRTFKGRRGCVTGQGELKQGGFDPLFSLNHTYAMLRANINRLFRKTWCTTKKMHRLEDHIAIYANYHNELVLEK